MSQTASVAAPVKESQLPSRLSWDLFLVSVLSLFLELLLIRWIGTEIRIFAYLQNTVLVVCFLGLGMGCMTCRRPFVLRDVLMPLSLLVGLLAIPWTRSVLAGISDMLSMFGGLLLWYPSATSTAGQKVALGVSGMVLTFLLMVLIWQLFVPLGRLLGRLMDDHPHTIRAYSINVAGSLVGIWMFVLLSALYLPPVVWFAVLAGLFLLLLGTSPHTRALDFVLLLGIVGLSWLAGQQPGALEVCWSPYQKLAIVDFDPSAPGSKGYIVTVNNVGFQEVVDLSVDPPRANPQYYPREDLGVTRYDIPLLLHPQPRKMLIVGSGTGNDVAAALRHHVDEVVAVEIDPAILALGLRYHPEKPYDSPRVRRVNDDARSFFATTTERFDVISFGLLDSHTTPNLTNARLDHYVYTLESLQRARSLLADGGILVLNFDVERTYIADRLGRALHQVFDQEPLVFPSASRMIIFVAGDLPAVRKRLADNPRLTDRIAGWEKARPVSLAGTTPLATDDWPYLYLEAPGIPLLYYFLAGLLLLLFLVGAWRLEISGVVTGWGKSNWHFFFLGAAFLLLEVQNISKAAVVLGNTWWVNAVIISSILTLILLANLLVSLWPRLPLLPVYVLLTGSCLGLYFLDISTFGFLPYAAKAAVVGGLTSLPMLFSGIVFIRSFAAAPRKDLALGANLFGALVGGLLQSITFVTGIKALLLIVTALYLAALWTRRGLPAAGTAEAAPGPAGG